mgnify:CR=1 FL=1
MRALFFLIRVLVYSNLFVSLCVTSLTHQTYILLKLPQDDKYYLLTFVFCSTLFTYNFQRIVRLKFRELLSKQIGIRLSWIVRNRRPLLFVSMLAGVISTCMLFFLNLQIILLTIPLAFFSIFYVIPVFTIDSKKAGLRDYPYIKIFLIALVWSMVITALPYFNYNDISNWKDSNFLLLLLEQFLFILAITLPFDVRDLKYDLEAKMKTIPIAIGVKKTILLAEFFLLVFIALKYYQFHLGQISIIQMISLAIVTFASGIFLLFTTTKRAELFYSGIIEGTMILMYLSILLLEY